MDDVFSQIGIAIGASKRLGWIALGLYIERLRQPGHNSRNGYHETMHEYYRRYNPQHYEMSNVMMMWSDDYRMALFPDELKQRLTMIEGGRATSAVKAAKQNTLVNRAASAKLKLDGG
jgi:hypothetical protein